jgi:hypothetical protein
MERTSLMAALRLTATSVLMCGFMLEERAAAQALPAFQLPPPSAGPDCSHAVAPGTTVNLLDYSVSGVGGQRVTFAPCSPTPAAGAAAAVVSPPLSNNLHEEVLDYLSDRGNSPTDVGTWNRVLSTWQVPFSNPSVPYRLSSGMGAGDDSPSVYVRAVLFYGASQEFGVTDSTGYRLTVAVEQASPVVAGGPPSHMVGVFYSTPVVVQPGDWIVSDVRIVRMDSVGMYGPELLWSLGYSINGKATAPVLVYTDGSANRPSLDYGFAGLLEADSITSCLQLPYTGLAYFRSMLFYWDAAAYPGQPGTYTQDTAGPWIRNGSPQVPGTTGYVNDCPGWPRMMTTAPDFALGWRTDVALTTPANVPAVPALGNFTGLVAVLLGLGGAAMVRMRAMRAR